MTVNPSIDPARLLEEQLAQASPDLLRELLGMFINTLLSAEADAVCGAEYGASTPERVNRRNGYRHRDFDTRAGTLDVAIPKLRQGSYFPEWLLERRKRAERALTSVVATCYLLGVSTRRMDKLIVVPRRRSKPQPKRESSAVAWATGPGRHVWRTCRRSTASQHLRSTAPRASGSGHRRCCGLHRPPRSSRVPPRHQRTRASEAAAVRIEDAPKHSLDIESFTSSGSKPESGLAISKSAQCEP